MPDTPSECLIIKALFARILAALPDAVTATVFLGLWVAPQYFGAGAVGNGMLVMLVEFVLLHAAILVPLGVAWVATRYKTDRSLIAAIVGIAAFYLLFLGAFSYAFGAWWPLLAFAWTMLAKFTVALPIASAKRGAGSRQGAVWLVSVLAYLGLAFLTLLLPLPELGIAGHDGSVLGIPDGASGAWVSNPHKVIAFGFLYFTILAYSKWKLMAPQHAAGGSASRPPPESNA